MRFAPIWYRRLCALHATISDLAAWAVLAGEDDLFSGTIGADIAAMRHKTQEVRILKHDQFRHLFWPAESGHRWPCWGWKNTLTAEFCRALAARCSMAVITNDIYTREDADFLTRAQVLPAARIRGVETGGCPHTAIREDASINLAGGGRSVADFF